MTSGTAPACSIHTHTHTEETPKRRRRRRNGLFSAVSGAALALVSSCSSAVPRQGRSSFSQSLLWFTFYALQRSFAPFPRARARARTVQAGAPFTPRSNQGCCILTSIHADTRGHRAPRVLRFSLRCSVIRHKGGGGARAHNRAAVVRRWRQSLFLERCSQVK